MIDPLISESNIIKVKKNKKTQTPLWRRIFFCCFPSVKQREKSNLSLHITQTENVGKQQQSSIIADLTDLQQNQSSSANKQQRQQKNAYPKQKPFFLSYRRNYIILAKITEKNFKESRNCRQLLLVDREDDQFKSILSDGCALEDSPQQPKTSPHLVAKYLAQKSSGSSLLIDLCCGAGSSTIEIKFARECDFVIGIDIDPKQIEVAQNLCKMNRLDDKVDFILSDCMSLKHLKSDIVFIHPSLDAVRSLESFHNKNYKSSQTTTEVNLVEDCNPNLQKCIESALFIGQSIILQLDYNIDIQQLASIFDNALQQSEDQKNLDYQIEIEEISVDGRKQCYLVYFGNISKFKKAEGLQFLASCLLKNGSEFEGVSFEHRILDILNYVENKIGMYKLVKICQVSNKASVFSDQNILHTFMQQIKDLNIFQEDLLFWKKSITPKNFSKTLSEFQDDRDSIIDQSISYATLFTPVNFQNQQKTVKTTQSPIEEKLYSPIDFSLQSEKFPHYLGQPFEQSYKDYYINQYMDDEDIYLDELPTN